MVDIKKAIFLDRDGTINKDEDGYIDSPEKFQLFPFAIEAIKLFNQMGFYVFIVTNQSGIARGYYSFETLEKIHSKLLSDLEKHNAKIDEIFISPYHKDGIISPYNIDHEDRKPNIGLFQKAMVKYNFIIKDSYMIGDKLSDLEFGWKAHLKTILVLTGEGKNTFLKREKWTTKPDFIVENVLVSAKLLQKLI